MKPGVFTRAEGIEIGVEDIFGSSLFCVG